MNLAAVSDTHDHPYDLPYPVKIIFHAGDLTIDGAWGQLLKAVDELLRQPADHRVIVAGNHDWCVQQRNEEARKLFKEAGIIYLEDEEVTVEGLRIYGSPYTLEYGAYAFQLPRARGFAAERKWAQIPEGIDILLTHSPPWGRFDVPFGSNNRVGCADLMVALQRIKPRVHIFGHVHSPGDVVGADGIRYINAAQTSTWAGRYHKTHEPVTFELEPNDSTSVRQEQVR